MPAIRKLKICLASSEVAPLAKTGGLADVSAALAAALHDAGHDTRLLMPYYDSIDTQALEITPVPGLQNIAIRIGHRDGHFSIDSTTLPGSSLTIYLLRCPELYARGRIYTNSDDEHLRFILLSRAAIIMCQHMQFAPDIMHCHDWHTALIPLYLKTYYAWDKLFANTRSVLTIHNIGYQGVFAAGIIADLDLGGSVSELHQDDLGNGRINFLKTGVLHADQLTTVSPTYADEIQGDEYGMGLQDLLSARSSTLVGILNGVDYNDWDPASDDRIAATYSPHDLQGKAVCKQQLQIDLGLPVSVERPLLGIVTRLVSQKGIDLMVQVLPSLLATRDFSLAVLGSGETHYEEFFHWLQRKFPGQVCFYRGYNERLAHAVEAGSDMFLMPSLYEPCGLNQMYSLKYGTVPIVRKTGGLADSVQLIDPADGSGTGIVFNSYNEAALAWAITTALDLYRNQPLWQQVMQNGMAQDFSWTRQAQQYIELFENLGTAT